MRHHGGTRRQRHSYTHGRRRERPGWLQLICCYATYDNTATTNFAKTTTHHSTTDMPHNQRQTPQQHTTSDRHHNNTQPATDTTPHHTTPHHTTPHHTNTHSTQHTHHTSFLVTLTSLHICLISHLFFSCTFHFSSGFFHLSPFLLASLISSLLSSLVNLIFVWIYEYTDVYMCM